MATIIDIAVLLNGEHRRVPAGLSVSALAAFLDLDPAKIAVERNRNIVVRSTFDSMMITDGDEIEIVHFVGGG